MKIKSWFLATTAGLCHLAYLSAAAEGQALASPATPSSAASTNQTVVLKNPAILRDGKLVELQGQWLYTKDGTAVFVPTEPISAPTANASQGGVSGQPLVLLVPAGGNAYPVQYQYYEPTSGRSVYRYYPSYHSYYQGGYYYRGGWYRGYGRHYSPYRHYGGSARFGYSSSGRFMLLPSKHGW